MQVQQPPDDFFLLNRALFAADLEFEEFKIALKQESFKSIRLNKYKPMQTNPFQDLESIKWVDLGRYVNKDLSPIKDPNWQMGGYYVQEASSMILANFIDKKPDQKILDLCAAPGGKSTLVANCVPSSCLIFANEVVTKRVHTLKENVIKEGLDNVVITQNQAVDFANLGQYFDVVFVDAPCSGEGLCRKTPDIWDLWSIEVVKQCSFRQIEILENIADSVKIGGQLIYSTCTFNALENEDVVSLFLENHPEFELEVLPFDKNWGLVSKIPGCYHLLPSKLKGEGLFIATLRKTKNSKNILKKNDKYSQNISPFVGFKPLEKKLVAQVSSWLNNPSNYNFFSYLKEIFIIPKIFKHDLEFFAKTNLRIHNFGVKIGKLKGLDFIPSQDLALFFDVNNNFRKYNLSLEQAQKVIAGEPLELENNQATTGWLLLKYNGLGLAFGKQVGNRINTYYNKG